MSPRITRTPSGRAFLNVGCGRKYSSDWTNVDLVAAPPDVAGVDLRRPLPFADCTFDAVYCSHVLEHFSQREGAALVRELHRCLAPGGVCRIVVPDFEQVCREYLSRLEEAALAEDPAADRRHRWALVQVIDQFVRDRSGGLVKELIVAGDIDEAYVRGCNGDELLETVRADAAHHDGARNPAAPLALLRRLASAVLPGRSFQRSGELHRWAHDRRSLAQVMASSGLRAVRVTSFADSAIPDWARYGLDARPDGRGPRKPGSLFMEGTRA